MPDITYKFIGDDEVTPTITKVKSQMSGLEHSAEGLGETFKELSAGIGYNIGLWNLGFMASQKAIEAVGNALSVTVPSLASYRQWMNTVGASNAEAATTFNDLRAVAIDTWTSIDETKKRSLSFQAAGWRPEQAVQETRMIQDQIKETGVDLGEAYQNARNYGATIQDALKVGIAHRRDRPEILEQALDDQRRQNLMKFVQFDMQMRFQGAKRVQEDQHRIDNYTLEDKRTAINEEMEDRHISVNREIEDRHRALGYEMEDRGRAMSRRMEDEQRQASLTAAVGAAMPGAFDVLQGKRPKGWTGYLGAQILQPEIKAGEAEIQKQTGIAPGTIEAAMRAGMSPGVVLQAAQMAREEKRAAEQRKFEDESIELQRQLVAELVGESRSQANEQLGATRSLAHEQRDLSRSQTAQNVEMSREQQDQVDDLHAEDLRRDQRREDLLRRQDERDVLESKYKPRPSAVVGPSMGAGGGEAGFGATVPITGMQGGGIVNKPTIAQIGEAGPEAVIPLHRLAGYSMGSVSEMKGGVIEAVKAQFPVSPEAKNLEFWKNFQSGWVDPRQRGGGGGDGVGVGTGSHSQHLSKLDRIILNTLATARLLDVLVKTFNS